MDVQLEETGQFGRKISVSIPAPDVQQAFDSVTKEVAKTAHLPGFRPGKAPRQIIFQQYKSRIHNEVMERLVAKSLLDALREKAVVPIATPAVQLGQLAPGEVFSFEAVFEVQPTITLTSYKGLQVPRFKEEVSDREVDERLESMRKEAAELVPVLVRDVVEQGDTVLLDYEGTMGGIPFQGGKDENALVEVGAPGYFPQFSEGLLGAKCPSEFVLPVDFPADYRVQELAGKSASFHMKLKELKSRNLPELDDEFAHDMGEENLEALKTKVRDRMSEQKKRDAEQEERQAVLRALAAANPFDVPESMIKEQGDRMIQTAKLQIERMMGGKRIQFTDKELADLREEQKERAELAVRGSVLLLEIAKQENIAIDNAEIDARIETMVAPMGSDAQRIRSIYHEPDNRERIRFQMLEDKVIQYVLDQAERVEIAPSV